MLNFISGRQLTNAFIGNAQIVVAAGADNYVDAADM